MVTGLCVHAIGAEVSEGRVPAHAAFLSSLHVRVQKSPNRKRLGSNRRQEADLQIFLFPGSKGD